MSHEKVEIGDRATLYNGDCLDVMRTMADGCVDAIVTDPPAGIAFMGKSWDNPDNYPISEMRLKDGYNRIPSPAIGSSSRNPTCKICGKRERGYKDRDPCRCEVPEFNEVERRHKDRDYFVDFLAVRLTEARRVIRPGGFMLCWAIPRTSHWTAMAIEQAGWTIRDRISNLVSGSDTIDRFIDSLSVDQRQAFEMVLETLFPSRLAHCFGSGFPKSKSCVKPSIEDWWLCKAPGKLLPLRIKAASIGTESTIRNQNDGPTWTGKFDGGQKLNGSESGRWPANLCLSHSSLPTMTLREDTPSEISVCIKEFFDGYVHVQAMRKNRGGHASEPERGKAILQPEMQGRLIANPPDSGANRSEMHVLLGDVPLSKGVGQRGEAKVLQPNLQGSLPFDDGRRVASEIRDTENQRGSREDRENESRKRSKEEVGSPCLEGRQNHGGGRLHTGDDRDSPRGLAENCQGDEAIGEIHPGAQDYCRCKVREATPSERGGSSQERNERGQRSGQPCLDGLGGSLQETPDHRKATGCCSCGDRKIEVLACDVPAGWMKYFKYTGEDLGCVEVGSSVLRGDQRGTPGGRRDGGFFGVGSENGSGEPNARVYGNETVTTWECVEGCPVRMLGEQSGKSESPSVVTQGQSRNQQTGLMYSGRDNRNCRKVVGHADSGTAARFFYQAKCSRADRDDGLDALPLRDASVCDRRPSGSMAQRIHRDEGRPDTVGRNTHPTVKSTALMQWLCRLITPEGGTVLDPFCGSGSTGKACMREGFRFVGIEQDTENGYFEIARRRIEHEIKKIDGDMPLFSGLNA